MSCPPNHFPLIFSDFKVVKPSNVCLYLEDKAFGVYESHALKCNPLYSHTQNLLPFMQLSQGSSLLQSRNCGRSSSCRRKLNLHFPILLIEFYREKPLDIIFSKLFWRHWGSDQMLLMVLDWLCAIKLVVTLSNPLKTFSPWWSVPNLVLQIF